MMETFGIVLKMHHPSVNRFDGDIFLVLFDYQNESGDDRTEVWSNNRSQLQSWHETIYTQKMQKLTSYQLLDDAKK